MHLSETAHVSGTVLDHVTYQPIAGARLKYGKFPEVVWTSAGGEFDFPAIYRWEWMPPLPIDRIAHQYLIVDATNHETMSVAVSQGGEESGLVIYLNPQSASH
jgi:hypothetical protein